MCLHEWDVRMAAANSLDPLLQSAKLAVEKQFPGASADFCCQQMLSYLWTHLMATNYEGARAHGHRLHGRRHP